MQTQQTITRTVQILDILPDAPPRLLTAERLTQDGKPGRVFQQLLPVPDAELFHRLTAQVGKGDTITITVTTEWTGDKYHSYLSNFALPLAPLRSDLEVLAA